MQMMLLMQRLSKLFQPGHGLPHCSVWAPLAFHVIWDCQLRPCGRLLPIGGKTVLKLGMHAESWYISFETGGLRHWPCWPQSDK